MAGRGYLNPIFDVEISRGKERERIGNKGLWWVGVKTFTKFGNSFPVFLLNQKFDQFVLLNQAGTPEIVRSHVTSMQFCECSLLGRTSRQCEFAGKRDGVEGQASEAADRSAERDEDPQTVRLGAFLSEANRQVAANRTLLHAEGVFWMVHSNRGVVHGALHRE